MDGLGKHRCTTEGGGEKGEGKKPRVGRKVVQGQYRYVADGDLKTLPMMGGRGFRGGSGISAGHFECKEEEDEEIV